MERNYKMQSNNAVYTNRNELLFYLRLFDTNLIIQQFLYYDSSFYLADKYLIAMVFIYFKRACLSLDDYTYLNFFAGLCLAHSMEEDLDLSSEIYSWALGNEIKKLLPKLLELKILLWEAMDYRAAVSLHCCKQLMSISQSHPIWQRERSSFYFKHIHIPSVSHNSQHTLKLKNSKKRKKIDKTVTY